MPVNDFFEPKAVVVHDGVTKDEPETFAEGVARNDALRNNVPGKSFGGSPSPAPEDRPIDLINELFELMKDLHVRDTTWRPEDNARLSALGNRIKALREIP